MDIKKSQVKFTVRDAQVASLERSMKSFNYSFKNGTVVVAGARSKSVVPSEPRKLRVSMGAKQKLRIA